MEPYAAHERCLEIPEGISAIYSFQASDSVDFDIHYHADGKTQYPRLERDVTEGTGSYRSRSTREYCLSWSNPREGNVELTVEVSTGRR